MSLFKNFRLYQERPTDIEKIRMEILQNNDSPFGNSQFDNVHNQPLTIPEFIPANDSPDEENEENEQEEPPVEPPKKESHKKRKKEKKDKKEKKEKKSKKDKKEKKEKNKKENDVFPCFLH